MPSRFALKALDLMRIIEAARDDEMMSAATRPPSKGLTCVSEIPVAEHRENKGEHENSEERDLAPGKQKPEQR